MTPERICGACGGGPVHGHGSRPVRNYVPDGSGLRLATFDIQRRRCQACGAWHDVEPAGYAETCRSADMVMVAMVAAEGLKGAARRLAMDERTLSERIAEVLDGALDGPLADVLFLTPVPGGKTLVLGDAGPGHVLDAVPPVDDVLDALLDRRGGDVSFAWLPFVVGIRDLARRSLGDATLALCTEETGKLLDRVVEGLPNGLSGEAALLREASRGGWSESSYDDLRRVVGHARQRHAFTGRAETTFNIWDAEIRNGFAAATASPGVVVPEDLHGLTPMRMRGLAILTPSPTLGALSARLRLQRGMTR